MFYSLVAAAIQKRVAFDSCGQGKRARDHLQHTHTHRSTPADRTVKRGEIEEDVEQRKEQIGCRSREEWGLAKPRRSGSLRDVEMNESLPRNQLIPGPRSVPRLRNAHTI